MTIWIVEDDAVILEGLTYSLTQEGYQVFTSGTVRDALVLLEQNTPFDFCLLDVMLPDGTGLRSAGLSGPEARCRFSFSQPAAMK